MNDSCIKIGSDDGHFNVLLIVTVRDKVTRQCPQTTTFEQKGEPKQNQAEALLLSSLTPYHYWLGQTLISVTAETDVKLKDYLCLGLHIFVLSFKMPFYMLSMWVKEKHLMNIWLSHACNILIICIAN